MSEKLKFWSGLNGKILTLAVLPILVLGGIIFVGNASITSSFGRSQEQLQALEENVATTDRIASSVSERNTTAQRLAARLTRNHQTMLLTSNPGAAGLTRQLRQQLMTELAALGGAVGELKTQLIEMGFIPQSDQDALTDTDEAKFSLEDRKAFYQLLRLATVLKNQLALLDAANERTLALVETGDFQQANSNFLFEERSRLDAFGRSLAKVDAALADTNEPLKRLMAAERDTLRGRSGEDISSTLSVILGLSLLIILAIIVTAYLVTSRLIIKPIHAQVDAMNMLADGAVDIAIPQSRDTDLGKIASALESFKSGLIEKAALEAQQKQAEEDEDRRKEEAAKLEQERLERERELERQQAEAERQRTEKIQALIRGFDARISEMLMSVGGASEALKTSAASMRQVAADSEAQSGEAASASQLASSNVSSVAAASEEMAASVSEISRQVARSSDMTRQASAQASGTNDVVQKLADNVARIDDIVKMINDIAEQTNLLALNATIEAARAGDAGKGFAVVASEVKALASQTAQATDDIQKQITLVQGMSSEASVGMREMLSVFEETTEISGSIAAAVEEQNASTIEISQAAGEAANGTDGVAANIERLKSGVQGARSASEQVFSASETLSAQSNELRTIIEGFLKDIEDAQQA